METVENKKKLQKITNNSLFELGFKEKSVFAAKMILKIPKQ